MVSWDREMAVVIEDDSLYWQHAKISTPEKFQFSQTRKMKRKNFACATLYIVHSTLYNVLKQGKEKQRTLLVQHRYKCLTRWQVRLRRPYITGLERTQLMDKRWHTAKMTSKLW